MSTKVLCVDDDAKILAGFQRALGDRFSIDTAEDCEEAFTLMVAQGPYAVVVVDRHMPGMDGIEFLTRVMEIAPDSVRFMLTGSAERNTPIDAVNQGHVFQFLTKPCPAKVLAHALEQGIKQYRHNVEIRHTKALSAGKKHPQQIFLDSFAKKQFEALVGFIDLCRFSEAACGKSPIEVRDLVTPFIRSVVRTAENHRCYIDKTIGDEVMTVMPFAKESDLLADKLLSSNRFVTPESMRFWDVGRFLLDLIDQLESAAPGVAFTAGFAFGQVLFDHVGTDSYSEWSVYGNCVNAAKRLQSIPYLKGNDESDKPKHRLAIGGLESDFPHFDQVLRYGLEMAFPATGIALQNPVIRLEPFKGVGRVWYLSASV